MKTINKTGMKEIADFLKANHKEGERLVANEAYMNAWAELAEENQDYLHIELKSWETWRGAAVVLEISPSGIDITPLDGEPK